ncbi:MAG: lipopolysaccharide biosynthesis protein [Nitrosomonadales bacterium]|nr:lipopolysaccharide biosynthesis protein [Nitrosomonadales bacterium]
MTEQQTNSVPQAYPEDDEISLLDLLLVLAKNKAMILKVTFAAALLSIGYAFTLPAIYSATAKILPPQQSQSSASAMLGQLGGLAGLAGGSLGIKNPNDLYIALLKSRTMQEKIAKRFDLQKIYETKTQTDTLHALEGNSIFTSGKDGVIAVEVSDLDPGRAAEIANAYVEELNTMMQVNALTDASLKRTFFEQQLHQARDKLTDAEIQLDRTPSTSLHYLDAMRNLKYQEALWEILAKQFAMAKMDEAKDFPLVQVLDKAIPPERKAKPKRSLIVILATLVAFFLSVIWAFVREAMLRAGEQPEQAARWTELRNAFRFKR